MKTSVFIKLFIWLLCAIGVVEVGCLLLSAADTLLNILALVLFAVFGFASYKTQLFTTIKITKK